ncbi:MAG: hypothetical protein AAB426_13265 [Myxococcota bacterium]
MAGNSNWVDLSRTTHPPVVYKPDLGADGRPQVDRVGSAAANLKEVGKALVDVLDPTTHLRPLLDPSEYSPGGNSYSDHIFFLGGLLVWPFAEVYDFGARGAGALMHSYHAASYLLTGAASVFRK